MVRQIDTHSVNASGSDTQIYFETSRGTILIAIGDEVIIGRASFEDAVSVIDLTPYGGLMAGVSRYHLCIVRTLSGRFLISDLDTRNGTHLNGRRIQPHEVYEIRNGDALCLGSMAITIHI
ncbi:MAG: FHA domain-containing protein [Chloroflexota bacterium]